MGKPTYDEWRGMSQSQRSKLTKERPRLALMYLDLDVSRLQRAADQELHRFDTPQGEGGTES